jgi:choline dehydrogenase-like flavoprotein
MATTEHVAAAAATATAADWLTAAQTRTLEAICDALLPGTPPPAGEVDADGYYARSARDLDVARQMAETLSEASPETKADFKKLLDTLNRPLMGMLLAGKPRGFAQLPPAAREAALRKMSTSSLAELRQGFQAVKRLAGFIYYAAPNADGVNPNWARLGYAPPAPPPSPEAAPKRIRTLPVTGETTLTADAVVVGSGAGGGLVAAQLAAAGKDVVVLEKGGYHSESDFNGLEADMTPKLYLRRGTLATHDLGMVILAGSTLGGGTTVNWSTSLRTPGDVLQEWERDYGVTDLTGPEHQRGFDAIEARLDVNTEDSDPNANNAALQRGCQALGYAWTRIPRNASDCRQRCGFCGFGCPYGRKHGTMLTYLQDASDGGARTVVRANAARVLIEAGRAVGVEGWVTDEATGQRHKLTVRAPIVVVAAGAVESPALLLRSGLTNPNIGKHLRLHPVITLLGRYAEPVEPWAGSLQTVLSDHFARVSGMYGFRIEVMPAHPGLLGLGTPWSDPRSFKRDMTMLRESAAYIVLTRDSGEGHITLDKQGDPILHYWPNELDRQHLIQGAQEVVKIALAGGATGVGMTHAPRLDGERLGSASAKERQAFLDEIARRGIVPNKQILGSAHQMGTCRFGGDAKTAVADPYGEVYGTRGLFIADGSAFPTASGTNPMLSIFGLAYRVAQHIISRG